MVVLNYTGGEVNAKIVYYGPGLSGKTTNLEHIFARTPERSKGKMVSMKTQTDRTLFFDFLPLELGEINGYRTRFLLYTVPGQVYYNATRKLVLKGADAVVFVADSSRAKFDENMESLRNLEQNLNEHGLSLDEIPWVIQYNKRDAADAMSVADLDARLNPTGVRTFEAIATGGQGVYETFHGIATDVYRVLKDRLERDDAPAPASDPVMAHATVTESALVAPSRHPDVSPSPSRPVAAPAPASPPAPAGQAPQGAEFELDNALDFALREVGGAEPARPAPAAAPPRTSEPAPAPVPRSAPKAPSAPVVAGDDTLFTAIPDTHFDLELGRLPGLDEATEASDSARDEGPNEFVTDPMRRVRAQAPPAPAPSAPVSAMVPLSAPSAPVVPVAPVVAAARPGTRDVLVPVCVPRAHADQGLPLRIILEVRFEDE